MNALSFLALIVLAIGIVVAYRAGVLRGSRNGKGEGARLRREIADQAAESWQMRELAEDRRSLLRAIADSRDETARYRQLLIDLENNAPPLLLDSPGAPDDLKLIVGVGPVLERLLQQLGINSYRQIARWTDRDIDEFNARLPDFPGRIRRDAWVTQARALHQSKYGEIVPSRERG
jgi:predicted flap endonuclease-1-like 5' DNA nuclease